MTLIWKRWFLEGETGPYVQYAYARIQSILRKADCQSLDSNYNLNDVESWKYQTGSKTSLA